MVGKKNNEPTDEQLKEMLEKLKHDMPDRAIPLLEKGESIDIYYDGQNIKSAKFLGFMNDGAIMISDNKNHVMGIRSWTVIRTSKPKNIKWINDMIKRGVF